MQIIVNVDVLTTKLIYFFVLSSSYGCFTGVKVVDTSSSLLLTLSYIIMCLLHSSQNSFAPQQCKISLMKQLCGQKKFYLSFFPITLTVLNVFNCSFNKA